MNIEQAQLEPALECDILLMQANDIYLEIESHYQAMQSNLSATSCQQILQRSDELNALFKQARTVDFMVAEALENTAGLSDSTTALLEQRGEILSRLYQGNRKVVARAKNVQSLLRNEINSLSTGQKAISGYKPPKTDRKNIIHATF